MATLMLLNGIISLIFGILVMVFPAMLRYTVGIYFIIIGLLNVIPALVS